MRAGVAALALLGASGCADVIGIEAMVRDDPPVALGPQCGVCVEATCHDAERRCAADPACADLAACVAAHRDDPAGRSQCRVDHPGAADLTSWTTLDGCMRSDCQADCTGIAGLFQAYGDDCEACVLGICPDQLGACVADASCEHAILAAFDDPAAMTPPKILSLWTDTENAASTCTGDPCGAVCNRTDENYTCLSAYDWPQPDMKLDEADVLVETRLTDGITTPLFGGVDLQSCAPLSEPCGVLDSTKSDADGRATLSVPIATSTGFRGYFRAFTEAPVEEVMVQNIFAGRPLYGPSRGQVLVLTPQTFDITLALATTTRIDGRAHVVVVFLDCAGNTSPGVTIGYPEEILVDASSRVFYPIQGSGPTEDNGWVLLLDVAPGCMEVTGLRGTTETHRGRFSAAPDVLTVEFLYPRTNIADVSYVCTPTFPLP